MRSLLLASIVVGVIADRGLSEEFYKLPVGTPELKSTGPLAFGPDGILLIGDTKAAAVVAISTGDRKGDADTAKFEIANIESKIADKLGSKSAKIVDLAVNPASGNIYVSLAGSPQIVRISTGGEIAPIALKKVGFSRIALKNPPPDREIRRGRRVRNPRNDSITDIAWVNGQVIVSGLGSGSSPSRIRSYHFPFNKKHSESSLEIYHGAHGKSEDYSAARTIVPFNIGGEPSVLAGFVCTPLVKFPVSKLTGEKVSATTVAELGNRNRPLDMIAYKKDSKDYILIANSARGVMKVSTEKLDRKDGITSRIRGTAGQKYDTIKPLEGTTQLDKLNDKTCVVIQNGTLKSVALP